MCCTCIILLRCVQCGFCPVTWYNKSGIFYRYSNPFKWMQFYSSIQGFKYLDSPFCTSIDSNNRQCRIYLRPVFRHWTLLRDETILFGFRNLKDQRRIVKHWPLIDKASSCKYRTRPARERSTPSSSSWAGISFHSPGQTTEFFPLLRLRFYFCYGKSLTIEAVSSLKKMPPKPRFVHGPIKDLP